MIRSKNQLGLFAAITAALVLTFPLSALAANTTADRLKNAARLQPNVAQWETVADELTQLTGTDTVYLDAGPLAADYVVATDSFVFSVASNLPKRTLTATGANALTLTIPVIAPQSDDAASGYKLQSFTIYETIGTLALTSNAVTLSKITYAAPPTAATVTITGTAPTATGSTATTHTVTTPFFIEGDAHRYAVNIVITPQNTSTWAYFGCRFKFTRT